MQTNETLLCPSYFAKSGAELFGVVNKEGRVEYLDESIKVDQTFVDAAQRYEDETGRAADERFRFAGKCIKGGCHQWSLESASCSLVGRIIEAMNKKQKAIHSFHIAPFVNIAGGLRSKAASLVLIAPKLFEVWNDQGLKRLIRMKVNF